MHTVFALIAQTLSSTASPALAVGDTALKTAVPAIHGAAVDWSTLRTAAEPDTARSRPHIKAIEYGDGYRMRLKIHRTLSYAMIPMFVGSYVTGNAILTNRNNPPDWARSLHKPLAYGTAALFTANTITGVWNFMEGRKDPRGQVKRTVHSLLFLAAGAGFAYTGTSLAESARNREDPGRFHRTVGMASMAIATLNWAVMILTR
ncbi:MAG: hypothetical protein HOP28_02470 [Gemmatimonadales bacterium]|nr:hypothetical protein [Gemmatimonadales bacterium]